MTRVAYDPMPIPQAAARPRRKWRRYPDGSLRHRIQAISRSGHPWYDWGHRLMILVGQWRGTGSYDTPRGRDMWYYELGRNKFYTTYDYSELRLYQWGDRAWKVFDTQDDGWTVKLGYWPEPGSDGQIHFYGISRAEMRLFRRWDFWECRVRAEWLGLRRWLYHKALHAAVHRKKPFACNYTPPKGSGGYSHWYCQLKRSHVRKGEPHRYNNYVYPVPTSPGLETE